MRADSCRAAQHQQAISPGRSEEKKKNRSSSHDHSSSPRHSSISHTGRKHLSLLSFFLPLSLAPIAHLSPLTPASRQLQSLARSRGNVLLQDDLMFTIYKRAEEKPQSSDAQGCLELHIQRLTPQCTPHINLCAKMTAEINCSLHVLTQKK